MFTEGELTQWLLELTEDWTSTDLEHDAERPADFARFTADARFVRRIGSHLSARHSPSNFVLPQDQVEYDGIGRTVCAVWSNVRLFPWHGIAESVPQLSSSTSTAQVLDSTASLCDSSV